MEHTSAFVQSTPAKRLGAFVLDGLYSYFAALFLSVFASGASGGFVVVFMFIAYVMIGMYFWSQGTSAGKMTLGMFVYDKRTGARLGFWSMLVRETLGKWISGLFLSLGFLWILFDEDNQGWHDKLVNSVVLERR